MVQTPRYYSTCLTCKAIGWQCGTHLSLWESVVLVELQFQVLGRTTQAIHIRGTQPYQLACPQVRPFEEHTLMTSCLSAILQRNTVLASRSSELMIPTR